MIKDKLIKRYIIYTLRRVNTDNSGGYTALFGPNNEWFYHYDDQGYDTEESAIAALSQESEDMVTILPVYWYED